jgi:transcription elongation factor S-II
LYVAFHSYIRVSQLTSSLRIASDVVAEHAKAVEAAVLAANDGSSYSAGYKTRIRQLMVNLKDKANPWLRESVVSGKLAADRLATMSTEDMASPEMKAEKARIQGENLFNSLAAHEQEAETDAFTCGRCKQASRRLPRCHMTDTHLNCRANAGIAKHRREVQTSR